VDYEPELEIFVEPGQHLFEARGAGDRTSYKTIDATAGSSQSLRLELPSVATLTPASLPAPSTQPFTDAPQADSRPRKIALFVGGALAVGGLSTGIGFGLSSNSSERDVQHYRALVGGAGCGNGQAPADCAALQDSVDSQRRKTLLANVGYGVAAVGFVTVGVALLWPRSHEASKSRAAKLELRWAGDAISVAGKF